MSKNELSANTSAAQEALRSFLATLLGSEAPLLIEEPVLADFDEANLRSKSNMVITAGTSPEDQWAVILDPSWLPVLSKSMLGEPISFGEPGADDLLKEVAAQAYGALRTQLSTSGATLGDSHIELLARGSELGDDRFATGLMEARFGLTFEGQELTGFALFPEPSDSEPEPTENSEPEQNDELDLDLTIPETVATKPAVEIAHASFPELGNETIGGDRDLDGSFALLAEVELEVTVELGRRRIPLAEVLRLTTGSVIELEKLVGEPLEVYANGRLIAEGEAVVMDEQFGIRITSLASNRQRAKAYV